MQSNAQRHRILTVRFATFAALLTCSVVLAGCDSRQVSHVLQYEVGHTAAGPADAEDVEALLTIIKGRLRGAGYARAVGKREIAVDVYGPIDEAQLELVRQRIESRGGLGFYLLAAENVPDDADAIERAKMLASNQKRVVLEDRFVAEWIPCNSQDFGPSVEADGRVVTRVADASAEVLVLRGPGDITGHHLLYVRRDDDGRGGATLNFAFNEPGSARMHEMSSQHLPDPQTGEMRYLGVVFDGRLIAAPAIVTPIAQQGQISGKTLSAEQIDAIIAILEEGGLPAALQEKSQVSAPR